MKVIINENEIGLLYKNGVFKCLLSPGKHRFWSALGERILQFETSGMLDCTEVNIHILIKDVKFLSFVAISDVPDDKLALHFIDGRIANVLKPGFYVFWNVFEKNTFEIIDVTEPDTAMNLPTSYIKYMPYNWITQQDVDDGEIGLLFYNGVYQRTLDAGTYYFWNHTVKVTVQKVDIRIKHLDVSGQEILTADKVSLRVNFVCSYQVVDPINVITKLKDCKTQLYVMVQLIMREFVGKYRFDELLRQKDSIGGYVLEKLKERESEFFVKFTDAGIKDIILPGEIRDIMNTVLVAEKTAQASVITRREETAATKSLLETAKLMDENSTLYKLKELEYLERICKTVGNLSVDSGGGIIANLRELLAAR